MTPAGELFSKLLRAHERAGGSPARRIGQACPTPRDVEERHALRRELDKASKAGAIELLWGKGSSRHLVERVYLADAGALYALTGQSTPAQIKDDILAALDAGPDPETREGAEALDLFREAFAEGRAICGIDPGDASRALETVRIVDAVCGKAGDRVAHLRAFSVDTFGDTKLLQKSWRRVCQVLRLLDLAQDESIENDEAVALRLGLLRANPLVHLAGPLSGPGIDLRIVTVAGLTEAVAGTLIPTTNAMSLLTVENWESFRRHVDEAMGTAEVVVYTGGWPSRATQSVLARLSRILVGKRLHWGDIDPAGLRIAEAVSGIVGGSTPHMMSRELAESHGVPGKPGRKPPPVVKDSSFADLCRYLGSPGHRILEQEKLAPSSIGQPRA